MFDLLATQGEMHARETFPCGNCNRDFEANIITWVDVSKTPRAKQALLKWEFNLIQCTHCGCRNFASSPFFYEDFGEGLLIAVFPGIPEKRGELEKAIRSQYGYYPVLEFFYDMTQIWMLIYFQEHYQANKNLQTLSRIGQGEERLRKMLRFLKEDSLMIAIREKLTESFFKDAASDELVDLLGQAVYTLEEMLPWPIDKRCICGADLEEEFKCCGKKIGLEEHEPLLSQRYVIYCPVCKEALSGTSCQQCGRVYTWKIGRVETYKMDDNASAQKPTRADQEPQAQL
jgi:hypothetical protein